MTRARPLIDGTRAIVRLLPTVSMPLTVAAYVLAVVAAAAPIGMIVVAGALVDRFAHGGARLGAGTSALLVSLPVLLVVHEAARQALVVVSGSLGRRVDGALRDRVLEASLAPAGIAHLEDPELRAVFGAARNLSPFFFTPGDAAQQLPWGLLPRVQGVLALILVVLLSPVAGVIALAVFVIAQVLAIGTIINLVTSSAFGMLTPEIVYLRELAMTAPPAKEVRIFGLGSWLDARFTALARRKLDDALAARRGQLRSFARIGVLLGLGLAVTGSIVGWQAARGSSLAALVTMTLALLRVFSPPNTMPDISIVYGSMTIASVERAASQVVPSVPVPDAPRPIAGPNAEIAFRTVRFGYGERPVLDGLNLVIPAGQQLAIVGLNGSGKTTLVKLLCRLYDPQIGSVSVDGIDLRAFEPTAWRAQLAVLFQEFIRWQLPASDNVALRADSDGTAPEVTAAATRAGVIEIIGALPDGWETPLSSGAAGGVDLSGGQWQRVALARAFHAVSHGARVLVFDEPTANLDARAEQQFFDDVLASRTLRTTPTGEPITTILISHRFATVRHADRIIVLSDGRVAEDGTHEQLLAADGEYASLFEIQARAFQEEVV